MYSSHRHLVRFSSPEARPRKGATMRDRLATLYDRFSEFDTDDSGRVSGHLAYVEALLRMRSTKHLNETQLQMRELLLDLLLVYTSGRSFPRGLFQKEENRPCFIDARGVLCPMGFLLAHTAGRSFAETVCKCENIQQLAPEHRARLDAWVEASGFSPEELALMQPNFKLHPEPKPKAQQGIHPLYIRLQNATQSRIGDYLARTFIGSRNFIAAQGASNGSRSITLAAIFGPQAEGGSEGLPQAQVLRLKGSDGEPQIALTFSRSF